MNASPHAHTYDSNKKETKRTYIQICMQHYETNGNTSTQIRALETKTIHKTSLSPITQHNMVKHKNDNKH